jgi:ubiquinone/menaquinone biosynthesis C-methylase UbiE
VPYPAGVAVILKELAMSTAEQLQHRYYTETAQRYDDLYGVADEHAVALRYMLGLSRQLGAATVLDVGSGTGRALRFFLDNGMDVRGAEPVAALTEQAIGKHGIPADRIVSGRGEKLPFPDGSFDVVCETGVLHHVADPAAVVREMMRVARTAVFLSDENRYGKGNILSNLFHIALYKVGLAGLYNFVRTLGKGYTVCPEDGIRYSYSVYQSLPLFSGWADRVFLIPTKGRKSRTWFQPLLTASHVLLCAIRDRQTTPPASSL